MEYDGSPSKFAKQIKEVHDSIVTDEAKADLEISTTHQYKGRERDVVVLSTDFTKTVVSSAEAMERNKPASEGAKLYRKLTDETNVLYVAMTRAKRVLVLNPQLDALLHYVHPPTFVPRRLSAAADEGRSDGGGGGGGSGGSRGGGGGVGGGRRRGGKGRASEAEGDRWNGSGSVEDCGSGGSASEGAARVGDWFRVQVIRCLPTHPLYLVCTPARTSVFMPPLPLLGRTLYLNQ